MASENEDRRRRSFPSWQELFYSQPADTDEVPEDRFEGMTAGSMTVGYSPSPEQRRVNDEFDALIEELRRTEGGRDD